MRNFIITIVVLFGLEAITGLFYLACGVTPKRSGAGIALTVLISTGLIIWGCILLDGAA